MPHTMDLMIFPPSIITENCQNFGDSTSSKKLNSEVKAGIPTDKSCIRTQPEGLEGLIVVINKAK